MPDRVLKRIKETGGVVMVNFYSCYLIPDCEHKKATVQDVVAHINHIRSTMIFSKIVKKYFPNNILQNKKKIFC